MLAEKNKTNEKAEVLKAIEDFFTALGKKDIKGMMSYYAFDVIVFDCKPPFQTKGAVAWKHTWEACLPYFPDSFKIEMRDVVIHTNGNLAIAHFLFRLVCPDKNHPASQTWMRASTGLKHQQGRWKAVHEHGSLPYNPVTMQALSTLEP
jgi:ketosteroid isomerase-like protein